MQCSCEGALKRREREQPTGFYGEAVSFSRVEMKLTQRRRERGEPQSLFFNHGRTRIRAKRVAMQRSATFRFVAAGILACRIRRHLAARPQNRTCELHRFHIKTPGWKPVDTAARMAAATIFRSTGLGARIHWRPCERAEPNPTWPRNIKTQFLPSFPNKSGHQRIKP